MTMTNTFVDDELEALQFPFYWDPSEEEDIPVKNYFENGYQNGNGNVKENKKKNKNHHKNAINVIEQQEDHKTTSSSLGEDTQDNNNEDSQENNCFGNEWPHYVNIAIHNHRNLSHSLPFTRGDSFESSQIFSVDKTRYTARSKLMQVFEIFPWFHIPQPSPTHRFRESLAPHKGEFIDNVTAAINYFWSEPFEEEDYSSLRAYYLQHGVPRRTFYSIIDLRSYMEKIRIDRQTKQLQSNLEAYSSRLSVVEDKLKELWLKVSSSSSSSSASFPLQAPLPIPIPIKFAFPIKEETPTLPTPTNWSSKSSNNNNDNDNNNDKKNKRKVDSLSDDLIKVAPKCQRVEKVEKILEILTIATDCGVQKETEKEEKEGKEGQEQRQYLESNLCHEEGNRSRNGSEDGDESDGSGLEMPFEYLDEISLDENYNFFF